MVGDGVQPFRVVCRDEFLGTQPDSHSIRAAGQGKPRPAGEHKSVKVEALISPELWERAQIQLKRNKGVSKRNGKRDCVLRGMIKCRCGRTMSGRMNAPSAGDLSYYVCTLHSESPRFCNQKFVRAEKIEGYVWHQIESFFDNGRLFQLALHRAQNDEVQSLHPQREELEMVEQQLKMCEREAKSCAAALRQAGDGIVARQLGQEREAIDQRHGALTARRTVLLNSLSAHHMTDETCARLLQFREDMARGIQNPTNADQRRFYERIGLHVALDGRKAQVKCPIRPSSTADDNPLVTRAEKRPSDNYTFLLQFEPVDLGPTPGPIAPLESAVCYVSGVNPVQ